MINISISIINTNTTVQPTFWGIFDPLVALSHTQGNLYGGSATDLNPIHRRLLSGDMIIKKDPGLIHQVIYLKPSTYMQERNPCNSKRANCYNCQNYHS